MDFFYPNKINDMWRIMGVIFYGDRNHFWDEAAKRFRLADIKAFLNERGIALWDTAMAVRRLRDNASDKFLEIVEPINLAALLAAHSTITRVIATGEKAASVVAAQAGVDVPSIGEPVDCSVAGFSIKLWRMPSTSRAYPLSLDKKADAYRQVFGR
jgi:G:T/U-mismatch repair DNA glycosylase